MKALSLSDGCISAHTGEVLDRHQMNSLHKFEHLNSINLLDGSGLIVTKCTTGTIDCAFPSNNKFIFRYSS